MLGGLYLIIQASEGQSNGVTRGYGKAVQIKAVEEPTSDEIAIKAVIFCNITPARGPVSNPDSFQSKNQNPPPPKKRRRVH